MKDSGTTYYKAYGDITGSRRGNFAAWVKSSKEVCTLDYYLQGNQKGRDNMKKCKVRPIIKAYFSNVIGGDNVDNNLTQSSSLSNSSFHP